LGDSKANPNALPDPDMEQRRQTVLKMLHDQPGIIRTWVADGDADPVTIHLVIRGKGTCELSIAVDRWDEFKFLEFMKRQEGTA